MKNAYYMLAEAWDSLERLSIKNAWDKLWADLEGEKDFNDDHREKITDFVQSIPGFSECNEEEESDPIDDETDGDKDNNYNEIARVPQMLTRFLR
ncbi:uncharacterized protein TNCV_4695841 [Trichonephila clavipes]|nr:uncharacterized protein TNCV_4695841 [Trichonephila clavipes]